MNLPNEDTLEKNEILGLIYHGIKIYKKPVDKERALRTR